MAAATMVAAMVAITVRRSRGVREVREEQGRVLDCLGRVCRACLPWKNRPILDL